MAGAPPNGRSIFPRGPDFNLETFSSKNFIVKDFVESLSDSVLPVSRRSVPSQQAFDPKPLIRAFEGMRPDCPFMGLFANAPQVHCHNLLVYLKI